MSTNNGFSTDSTTYRVTDVFTERGVVMCQIEGGNVYRLIRSADLKYPGAFVEKVWNAGRMTRSAWQQVYVPQAGYDMTFGEYFDGEPTLYRESRYFSGQP